MGHLRFLFCLLILHSFSPALFSQESKQLLNKAIYEEEINGDLENAIAMYISIVNEYAHDRPVAGAGRHTLPARKALTGSPSGTAQEKVSNTGE